MGVQLVVGTNDLAVDEHLDTRSHVVPGAVQSLLLICACHVQLY
jgi:hypothetical protein